MPHTKEIATAVGTLAIAIGIGFVMQRSESAQEYYGSPPEAEAEDLQSVTTSPSDADFEPILNGAASADIILQIQDVELTSSGDDVNASMPYSAGDVRHGSPFAPDLSQAAVDPASNENCDITAQTTVIPGALISLDLNAPCAPNERLTVHHNGMIFTETTDDAGKSVFTVPALTQEAVIIMAFASGDGTVAQVDVPDVNDFDRIVLQWRGQSGFELHAYEFGAGFGDAGHVWAGADQNFTGLITGENGVVLSLGDRLSPEPLIAEVYTFPSAKSAHAGVVDLSVEAEVTATNCGLEIEAQSLEKLADGEMKNHFLTFAVPDCGAIGSFLVLNNLVADLKVASN